MSLLLCAWCALLFARHRETPVPAILWTPAYVLLHLMELRWVEEPALEERFGEEYRAYRTRVPMFIPRFRRRW